MYKEKGKFVQMYLEFKMYIIILLYYLLQVTQ